jgi:hypothetical protein
MCKVGDPEVDHIAGSRREPCTDCCQPIWVAPSTLELGPDVVTVCWPCGRRRIAVDISPMFADRLTDAQRAELAAPRVG